MFQDPNGDEDEDEDEDEGADNDNGIKDNVEDLNDVT